MKIINSMLNCASSDKHRNSINGIYLDSVNQTMIATDGHQMILKKPTELIKESKLINFTKMSGKELDYNQDANTISNDKKLTCNAVENKDINYPDWKQVIPEVKEKLTEIYISFDLLEKVVNAMGLDAKHRIVKLSITEEHAPLLVTNLDNDDLGIVMPININKHKKEAINLADSIKLYTEAK